MPASSVRSAMLMALWFVCPALVIMLGGGILRETFSNLGFARQSSGQFAFFTLGCLQLLLYPVLAMVSAYPRRLLNLLLLCVGALLGGLLLVDLSTAIGTACVVLAYSLLIVFAAMLWGMILRASAAAVAFLLSVFFFTSFFWSGEFAGYSWGMDAAVWLAPQAVVSSALNGFSFSQLPDIYRIWLGPVAPVPSGAFTATLYYLIPAALFWLVRQAILWIAAERKDDSASKAQADG